MTLFRELEGEIIYVPKFTCFCKLGGWLPFLQRGKGDSELECCSCNGYS